MRSELEFLQKHSLTSVLQRELETLILSGEFSPGERLNENALAARFSVSRGPVREVCRALAEKGLLELIPNRGVFMRRIDEAEAAELYDLR
ncbi:MAG TPA: GntR family transcriptional regulator, partial [Mesorhizobium sp.]